MRRAIRDIVSAGPRARGQGGNRREGNPLENYVRSLARASGIPEGTVWRSAQVREYAKKFGLTPVLEEKLREVV